MTLFDNTKRASVYETVTAQIIKSLESGVRPWEAKWSGGGSLQMPRNHAGRHYNGVNVIVLWAAAQQHGFTSPHWLTFKQALELGGNVRKGEKSPARVVYYSTFTPEGEKDKGDDARAIPFAKPYAVFNAEQCEGLPARFTPLQMPPRASWAQDERAARFVANTGAKVTDMGARAFYRPSTDEIVMPSRDRWASSADYYSVLFHELTHWTSHVSRCDRELGKRFGDQAYAVEELVAELGAAFLGASVQLTPTPRDDHAAYLESWLKCLKADSRAIFTAAAAAQKAANYLHGLQEAAATVEA